MKDRRKIEPLLRAFKLGHVDLEYSIDFILKVYSDSKRFNWANFSIGMSTGGIIMLIILEILK